MSQGNRQTGPERNGYRGGRKPLHPPGTPLGRINIAVEMPSHSVCRVLGAGNAAKGARIAIEWAARVMPLWAQDEKQVSSMLQGEVYGKVRALEVAAEAYERLERALRAGWDDEQPLTELRVAPKRFPDSKYAELEDADDNGPDSRPDPSANQESDE